MASVLSELDTLYDPPRSFLTWRTPLDLVVATVLSAQCTDVIVERVTKNLFKKYSTPEDYVRVSREELEQDIHSCGTYRNKARFIQELCHILLQEHGGEVPETMEELTKLPGVGRKTASIVLYAAFNKNEGIAVDTHVLRLAKRLGFTKRKTQDSIELDLMKQVPKKDWGKVNKLLISHGRAVCTAQNRSCDRCIFQDDCPSSLVHKRADLSKKK